MYITFCINNQHFNCSNYKERSSFLLSLFFFKYATHQTYNHVHSLGISTVENSHKKKKNKKILDVDKSTRNIGACDLVLRKHFSSKK